MKRKDILHSMMLMSLQNFSCTFKCHPPIYDDVPHVPQGQTLDSFTYFLTLDYIGKSAVHY